MTLVGPSGCGKTTLIRIIAGIESQDSGSVLIGGSAIDHLRPHERRVAMVFQSYALYPHMSVRANLSLPLVMSRLRLHERLPLVRLLSGRRRAVMRGIESEVEAVAQQLQLGALLDRRPAQLSGGQRQRVALGRAMVRHPDVFLMDEPLSNLDAKLRVHMRTELAELHQRLGATFIYVTHDQVEAMTMSNRVAMMDSGDIIQLGTPTELYARPANVKVAQFIGSPAINLLPGTRRRGRPGRAARPPAGARGRASGGRRPHHRHPPRGDRGATRDGGSGRRGLAARASAPARKPRCRAHPPLRLAGRRPHACRRPRTGTAALAGGRPGCAHLRHHGLPPLRCVGRSRRGTGRERRRSRRARAGRRAFQVLTRDGLRQRSPRRLAARGSSGSSA